MKISIEAHTRVKVRAAKDRKEIRQVMMEAFELYDKQPLSKTEKQD